MGHDSKSVCASCHTLEHSSPFGARHSKTFLPKLRLPQPPKLGGRVYSGHIQINALPGFWPGATDQLTRLTRARMLLPGETEAGSAGMQPCRGIAWRAHRNDEWQRRNVFLALLPNPHRIGRPRCHFRLNQDVLATPSPSCIPATGTDSLRGNWSPGTNSRSTPPGAPLSGRCCPAGTPL